MSGFIRWLIGVAVFIGILLLGNLFGIRPSSAEVLLVAVACGFAEGVREGLS